MYHLVFDTNVLRNEHFDSPRMKVLKRLIDENLLKIYIPELVKREFLTQKQQEFQEKLKSKNIIDVDRFFVSDYHKIKDKLSVIEKSMKELHSNIEHFIDIEFNNWVSDYKIEILPFNSSKITEVMDNYFTGGTVFKNKKNRQDIPDAMICSSIKELQLEVGVIYVLINDTTFKKYLDTQFNITTFESTKAFLEHNLIIDEINLLDKKHKQYELLSGYLTSCLFKDYLFTYLTTKSTILEDIYLENDDISNMSLLGKYVFYCTLESAENSTLSDLEIKKAELADENEYFLYVSFKANGMLHFGTEYHEYIQLEEDKNRDVEYYNMKGDGATSLRESRTLKFNGVLSININDMDSDNPEALLNYDSLELDVDEVEILPLN